MVYAKYVLRHDETLHEKLREMTAERDAALARAERAEAVLRLIPTLWVARDPGTHGWLSAVTAILALVEDVLAATE